MVPSVIPIEAISVDSELISYVTEKNAVKEKNFAF